MVEGGTYSFQRDLWRAVAELNFCLYWSQPYAAPDGKKRRRHALVGKTINVRATVAMAEYLEQAIQRITKERIGNEWLMSSNYAWSFRKGAAWAVTMKLMDRRDEMIEREEREIKKRAAEAAAADASGASASTALTLATLAQNEEDANEDFLHGDGYSARKRAREKETINDADQDSIPQGR